FTLTIPLRYYDWVTGALTNRANASSQALTLAEAMSSDISPPGPPAPPNPPGPPGPPGDAPPPPPPPPTGEQEQFLLFHRFQQFQAFMQANGSLSGSSTPGSFSVTSSSTSATAPALESFSPPPFVPINSGGPSPGTSLIRQFKTIPRATILEIVRFTFYPLNLCKLHHVGKDRSASTKNAFEVENGELTVKPRTGTSKDFPTFHHLLVPLTVYFDILAAHALSSGNARSVYIIAQCQAAYIRELSKLNARYLWTAVLAYHEEFFVARQTEMEEGDFSGWLTIDQALLNDHCALHLRPQVKTGKTASPSSSPSKDSGRASVVPSSSKSSPSSARSSRSNLSDLSISLPTTHVISSSLDNSIGSPNSISSDIKLDLAHAHLFPPLPLPPLRPNSDPRCNLALGPPTVLPPSRRTVSSPLIPEAWAFFLRDYPDKTFVSSILHIIQHGADIGFRSNEVILPCSNLPSAFEDTAFMDQAVSKMVSNEQVHGPFSAAPIPNLRCSPLGSVTRKRNPSKRRLINHLSWPDGKSVNDGISDNEAFIAYDLFERAIEDLVASGPSSLMAKLDLKEAFRHVPIRPDDWHHLGFSWKNQLYYCVVLTFGLRSAPYIFNLFAEALHWIIQHHIPARLRHYLDDFLLTFPPQDDPSFCHAAVEWVISLGRSLGLCFQDEKTLWPSHVVDFLGIELDSLRMEARLPTDKLKILTDLLTDWQNKRLVSLRETQELSGYLQFASQVIPFSRSFMRRIFDFQSRFHSRFHRLHVSSGVRADLRWWTTFCTPWNGVRLLGQAQRLHHVFTDASGTKGIGGHFENSWFASRVPRRFRSRDIQFKELYAVLQAILRWADEWSSSHVVFHCDNQAVVAWLETGTSRSSPSMPILRTISMLAAHFQFSFSSTWISTDDNGIADAASRFQYARMFNLNPNFPPSSTSTKSQITGIKRLLTSHDASLSSSGTGSQLPHDKAMRPARGQPLPASSEAIAEWIGDMVFRNLSSSTIRSYISALRSLHIDLGLPYTAFDSPVLQRVLRGAKRLLGSKQVLRKLPINLEILQKISATTPTSPTIDDLVFDAAIKLAWSGFLRCGEFTTKSKFSPSTNLTRDSIDFKPSFDDADHIKLTLPSSKTDTFRKGVTITISAAGNGVSTCPVAALKALFSASPTQSPRDPLFQLANGSPLSRSHYITTLHERLRAVGIDPTAYSGHSFRRGAATAANAAGYSDVEIQLLGRWRSDAYKLYIDTPPDRVLALSKRLHSSVALTPVHALDPLDLL
ncbi:hypothetical protein CVT24_012140, partial [Panaeolus cyanescens]